MAKYRVEIKRSAVQEIKTRPSQDLKKVLEKIALLSENPRPSGSVKLTAGEKYRLRAGRYRILYTSEDDRLVVTVVKAGHRRDVYRS